jgi:2'-5' RNA ligase
MQKYVLVTFLEPVEEGTEFTVGHWPLHTTLVSNFVADLEAGHLVSKLTELFAQHKALETVALQDEHFGPQKQVHVTLLQLTPELRALHKAAMRIIKDSGAVFDEPKYLDEGFRPHVTVQQDARVNEGDSVVISTVSLVDMFPHNDIRQRKVMQTFKLSA